MVCLGCGTEIPELHILVMRARVRAAGGDPDTLEVGVCDNCPAEAHAQWEYEKLNNKDMAYGRLNSEKIDLPGAPPNGFNDSPDGSGKT